MLDHSADIIRNAGGIEYLHAGNFESAHRNFKSFYHNTSRRKIYALSKTLEHQAVLEESEKKTTKVELVLFQTWLEIGSFECQKCFKRKW